MPTRTQAAPGEDEQRTTRDGIAAATHATPSRGPPSAVAVRALLFSTYSAISSAFSRAAASERRRAVSAFEEQNLLWGGVEPEHGDPPRDKERVPVGRCAGGVGSFHKVSEARLGGAAIATALGFVDPSSPFPELAPFFGDILGVRPELSAI